MQLGHLFTRSSLTHPEVPLTVSPGSFCLLVCCFYITLSILLQGTLIIRVANTFFRITAFCPKLMYLVCVCFTFCPNVYCCFSRVTHQSCCFSRVTHQSCCFSRVTHQSCCFLSRNSSILLFFSCNSSTLLFFSCNSPILLLFFLRLLL